MTGSAAPSSPSETRTASRRLFLLSFAALFLELMVIRWVPSEVKLVAYYANLMLVSSFLGLGIGALASARRGRLFPWFPGLFAANLLLLLWLGGDLLPSGAGELRFAETTQSLRAYASLLLVFAGNAAMFAPVGAAMGEQFARLPALGAYAWDLAGSLAGTLVFGLFSLGAFSPLLGLAGVALLLLAGTGLRPKWWGVLACLLALGALALTARRDVIWSPYYHITIGENFLKFDAGGPAAGVGQLADGPAGAIPADLRTRRDPPLYTLRVNQDFYQRHGSVDLRRYDPAGWRAQAAATLAGQYNVPYALLPPPRRVLVLGAGGGMDVETALLHGAEHVDAVEIDPQIMRLSNRLNAAAPYLDPRVAVHVDDGRAFLQRATADYDLVAFGFLDSQALFSYGASLRLDGYIYTVESFRQAYGRVRPGGALAVWFVAGREWMAQKLVQMMARATGGEPLVYARGNSVAIIAPRGPLAQPAPADIGGWRRVRAAPQPVDLATDDWPYLYLAARAVPRDYAIVIGLLLLVSLGAVFGLRGTAWGATDSHFLFLGWGFLLLQTRSIGDCSLYFGTTWLVTTLVITGVLLMVLLANGVALRRLPRFTPWLYLPLFLSLLVLFAVPREFILAQSLAARVAWTLVMVPLPVFFAGLVFSTTFREAGSAPARFGANLIGATLGGFCEYLGMWTGSQLLGIIVLAAYAGSLLCMRRIRAAG